ncbi:hypothetical protein ACRAWF_07760 [Streptomyces sp. L7]
MPPETLELLLHRRRTLVVFDGLDEVTVTERDQTREDIVEFSRMHPDASVVVTSRPGVSTKKFDESGFVRYRFEPSPPSMSTRTSTNGWQRRGHCSTPRAVEGEGHRAEHCRAGVHPSAGGPTGLPFTLGSVVSRTAPLDLYEGTYSMLFERREMYRGIRRSGVDPNTLGGLMCSLAYRFVISRPAGTGDMASEEFRRAISQGAKVAPAPGTWRTVVLLEEPFALLCHLRVPGAPHERLGRRSGAAVDARVDPFGQYLAAVPSHGLWRRYRLHHPGAEGGAGHRIRRGRRLRRPRC